MNLDELVTLILGLIIVSFTLLALLEVFSPFFQGSDIAVNTMFESVCANPEGVGVLNDINYNQKSSLVQLMLPYGAESRFVYPRNTYAILSALFDTESDNLESAVDSMQGLYNERKNHNLLDNCRNNACFCVVRTGMDYITYENLELTACFPRLYAYARNDFDDNFVINNNGALNEWELFGKTIIDTLNGLDDSDEANEIKECYNWFNTYSYIYEGVPGQYFLTIEKKDSELLGADSDTLFEALTSFYSLTRAGLFNEISTCAAIPNEDNCFCPYINGSIMYSDSTLLGKGLFIGIAGSNLGLVNDVDVAALITHLDFTGAACNIRIGTDISGQ